MDVAVPTVAASIAAMLLVPDDGRAAVARLTGQAPIGRWPQWVFLLLAVVGAAALLPAVRPAPHHVVVAATAAGVVGVGAVLLRRGRRRASRAVARRRVVDMCDALVAELHAGQPPGQALAWVARSWPDLEAASAVARLGGDVPAALRQAAQLPGVEPVGQIAVGWDVAHRSGARLSDVLDRLSRALRDDDDVRREVSASLGPTRATGRLLAILPVFGLGLGYSMGADPLAVLLGTTFGSLSLAAGAALAVGGLLWIDRIADRAETC
ncbi:MAG TPA: type II secretion system F family protein [Nocardioidaceae bacterium]|nr:type II secretion system F family protein [Nocardioidaceae bacterium]